MNYNLLTGASSPALDEMAYAPAKTINIAIAAANAEYNKYLKTLTRVKTDFLKRGVYRSSRLNLHVSAAYTEYTAAVSRLQTRLNLELKLYSGEYSQANYIVDYSLPLNARYVIVKDYYTAFLNRQHMMDVYSQDDTAKSYLDSFYYTLFDYLNYLKENNL